MFLDRHSFYDCKTLFNGLLFQCSFTNYMFEAPSDLERLTVTPLDRHDSLM